MKIKYLNIFFIIKTEWKIGNINIAKSNKKLIQFAKIKKKNNQTPGQSRISKKFTLLLND